MNCYINTYKMWENQSFIKMVIWQKTTMKAELHGHRCLFKVVRYVKF